LCALSTNSKRWVSKCNYCCSEWTLLATIAASHGRDLPSGKAVVTDPLTIETEQRWP